MDIEKRYDQLMKHLFLIIFLQFITQTVFAFPITPQTLRKLIENSQYIVIAKVDNPEPKGEPVKIFDEEKNDTVIMYRMTFGGDGLADLHINECLKGDLSVARIQVSYEAGMICPAPASYPDQKIVIAFLYKKETDSTFSTQGLSYGSKIMYSEEALSAYRASILAYLEILKIANLNERKKATVECLVRCSENNYTRWDGAYELSREGHYIAYYDRSTDPKFYKKLTKSQLQRLDSTFFAAETIGYSELCLSNLLSKQSYPRLKAHLLHHLESANYYLASDIMKRIMDLDPSKELLSVYEEFRNISFDDREIEGKYQILVKQFVRVASE